MHLLVKILSLVLTLVSLHCYNQQNKKSHLFYYTMVYNGSKNDSTSIKGEAKFVLSVQDSISIFSNVKNVHKDSILLHWKNLPKNIKGNLSMAGVPRTPFTYYIKKHNSKNDVTTFDLIGGKNFYYNENFPKDRWILKEGTRIIEGFKCYNAEITIFGRNFIAWYTPEIPFQDGPYKFSGLPGLIVELYDSENMYKFKLVEYNPNDHQFISIPELRKYKMSKTDKLTFIKAKENYQENLAEIAKSMGLQVSEERAKQIRERSKNKVSPLEVSE